MREINSKSQRTKKRLAWEFYEPYEEDGKETDLKWYFCNLCYAKKPDKMKDMMTVMILDDNRNTSSFRNHVVTAHKMIFQKILIHG